MIHPRSRLLVASGLVLMFVGGLDPLEGSVVILVGVALVALGAWLGRSPYAALLVGALALVAAGVAMLWGWSAAGGVGGDSGRSIWWGLTLLPYPIGVVMALAGAVGSLRKPTAT